MGSGHEGEGGESHGTVEVAGQERVARLMCGFMEWKRPGGK